MTDRHCGYIITLENDIREDDAEATINALRMIKGVLLPLILLFPIQWLILTVPLSAKNLFGKLQRYCIENTSCTSR